VISDRDSLAGVTRRAPKADLGSGGRGAASGASLVMDIISVPAAAGDPRSTTSTDLSGQNETPNLVHLATAAYLGTLIRGPQCATTEPARTSTVIPGIRHLTTRGRAECAGVLGRACGSR
jgi:hypothetical protein